MHAQDQNILIKLSAINPAEAMWWLTRAAEQGDRLAQRKLGVIYSTGRGVRVDPVKAHMWFNLAAASGDTGAIELRNSAVRKMTAAQIQEAQRLAREWRPKAKSAVSGSERRPIGLSEASGHAR